VEAFEALGNPFLDDSCDLVDLDESIVMSAKVRENVQNIKVIGWQKYEEFTRKRIGSNEEAFTAPIHQTKMEVVQG
jgi:hypothetical protein